MAKVLRLVLPLLVVLALFSNTFVQAEKVDEDALKRHVYATNKGLFQSKNWLERAGACERIGTLGIKEYAADILPLLTDTHPLVRLSAIRGLGMAGDTAVIPKLVEYCVSLGHRNDDRLFAVNCGWAIGQLDAEAGAEMLLLKHEEKKTGEYAVAAALGYIGGQKASEGIGKFLSSKDQDIFEVAIRSSARLTNELDPKALAKKLNDKDSTLATKLAIISTFRKRGMKDSIQPMLSLMNGTLNKEEDLQIANAAAYAIGVIGPSERELTLLTEMAKKGNDRVKLAALKAFTMGAAEGKGELVEPFLASKDPQVRIATCEAAMTTPSPKLKSALTKMLNSDRSRFAKWYAAMALGYMRDETVTAQLADMAKNARDKDMAAKLLEALTIPKDPASVDKIIDLIKAANVNDVELVLLAGMALSDISRETGGIRLSAMLNDNDANLRLKAVRALRFFPTSVVVQTLIGQLERNFDKTRPTIVDEYRAEVLSALERLTGHRFKPESKVWMEWWKFYEKIQKKKDEAAKEKKTTKQESRRDKDETVKFFGGSGESEESVELGLHWLSRYMFPQGMWDPQNFDKLGSFSGDVKAMDNAEVGISGLAVLALATAGYTHLTGKYMDVMDRALDWLLAAQTAAGVWRPVERSAYGDCESYEHAIATTALLEIYSLSLDEKLKQPCQAAVNHIAAYQNILKGWRYTFLMPDDTDSSVTGWYVLALKSAKVYGFRVFEKAFEGALRWYDSVSQKIGEYETPDLRETKYFDNYIQDIYQKCGSGYDDAQPLAAMTAISLITHRFIGYKRTHPLMRAYANYLKDWKVNFNQATGARNLNFAFYFIYYTTLANFQMGADYWSDWNKQLVEKVRSVQEMDPTNDFYGSWGAGKTKAGVEVGSATGAIRGGRIYCTALMVLTMEVYYRYNPMLEENEIVIE